MTTFIESQLRHGEHVISKIEGAMQYGDDLYTSFPGFLTLTNQRIFWTPVGWLQGKEVENSFELKDVKSLRYGSMIIQHHIVIYLKNGDSHLINQIDKGAGKAFAVKANNYIKA